MDTDTLTSKVQAAQRGEEAAFTELLRELHGVVLHQAQRMLRDPNDAQDCAQEAFAEAFSTLGRLKDARAFPAWLRSIVRHRCLRRQAQQRRTGGRNSRPFRSRRGRLPGRPMTHRRR